MTETVIHEITDPAFFYGGNAHFTVSNPKGERFTFRIQKLDEKKKRNPSGPDIYFAGVMTGSDNNRSYSYLGLFNPFNWVKHENDTKKQRESFIRMTAKSKFREDSVQLAVMRWAIWVVVTEQKIPEGYKIQHEGRCGKCNRRLTVPESIERGIGPICYEQMVASVRSFIKAHLDAGNPLVSLLTHGNVLVRKLVKEQMK